MARPARANGGPRSRSEAPIADDTTDILSCIRGSRKACVSYVDRSGRSTTTRLIWPIALLPGDGTSYVVAWCERRAAFRSFRIDRITGWMSLYERAERSRRALLAEWRASAESG
jgi:predicted DNA-binding transcriptional regulator YafY